jgi:hypothetical protein
MEHDAFRTVRGATSAPEACLFGRLLPSGQISACRSPFIHRRYSLERGKLRLGHLASALVQQLTLPSISLHGSSALMRASHFAGDALSDTNADRRLSNRLAFFQDGVDHFCPTTGMSPVGQELRSCALGTSASMRLAAFELRSQACHERAFLVHKFISRNATMERTIPCDWIAAASVRHSVANATRLEPRLPASGRRYSR